MKDSMTLPTLVRKIQKAHTPAPDIHMIDIFDTKNWIKPFVNKIKNRVYPHTYRFFKRNGQVRMKYLKTGR